MTAYRCLVLDHDDTAVMSTPSVHYPSFVDTLRHLRPEFQMTLEEYTRLCFDPGFDKMCTDVLHFSPEEEAWQLKNWQRHVDRQIPPFHPGMADVIRRQKAEGGLVCVVSLSYARYVERDYASAGLPLPDLTLGWELGAAHQKPHPEPLRHIMQKYGLRPDEMLVVDDLKPGYEMARAVNVPFAAALWTYAQNPSLRRYVLENCPTALPLDTLQALYTLLFSP